LKKAGISLIVLKRVFDQAAMQKTQHFKAGRYLSLMELLMYSEHFNRQAVMFTFMFAVKRVLPCQQQAFFGRKVFHHATCQFINDTADDTFIVAMNNCASQLFQQRKQISVLRVDLRITDQGLLVELCQCPSPPFYRMIAKQRD
jgi:hypothetical protein